MSKLKITSMGYRGKLPGDKKREEQTAAKAERLLKLTEEAEKRGKEVRWK